MFSWLKPTPSISNETQLVIDDDRRRMRARRNYVRHEENLAYGSPSRESFTRPIDIITR
jgi:hypothetical protein